MAVDKYQTIRERVPAVEASRFYRLEFDSQGKRCRCCYHSPDRHPSMSFKGNYFKCWACGKSGSSIDLTMQVFGLTAPEAARRLNTDFQLGLVFDSGEPTAKEYQEARERRELVKAHENFEAWRTNYINALNAVYRRGHLALLSGKEPTGADAEAVRRMATAEYYADALSCGSPED